MPTTTGTIVAIAIDLVDTGDGAPTPSDPYLEIWTPAGELRIPRSELPDHQLGDTVAITIGPAE